MRKLVEMVQSLKVVIDQLDSLYYPISWRLVRQGDRYYFELGRKAQFEQQKLLRQFPWFLGVQVDLNQGREPKRR